MTAKYQGLASASWEGSYTGPVIWWIRLPIDELWEGWMATYQHGDLPASGNVSIWMDFLTPQEPITSLHSPIYSPIPSHFSGPYQLAQRSVQLFCTLKALISFGVADILIELHTINTIWRFKPLSWQKRRMTMSGNSTVLCTCKIIWQCGRWGLLYFESESSLQMSMRLHNWIYSHYISSSRSSFRA